MAQIYKMTLYVCDLEENLSLKEIKNLIKDRALSGISVGAICKFTGEQIGQLGQRIEWDDDIDINHHNCPADAWEKYFKCGEKMGGGEGE